jgi:hypothetical protein
MGMFPYKCEYCSGAYFRCGADHSRDHDTALEESIVSQYEDDVDEVIHPQPEEDWCASESDDEPDETCHGGQFCWESNVVVFDFTKPPDNIPTMDELPHCPLIGLYDGFGRALVRDATSPWYGCEFIPKEFAELVPTWNEDRPPQPAIICEIACLSCFTKHNITTP